MIDVKSGTISLQNGKTLFSALSDKSYLMQLFPNAKIIGRPSSSERVSIGAFKLENSLEYSVLLHLVDGKLHDVAFTILTEENDKSWEMETLIAEKQTNDKLLLKILGQPPYSYPWGTVESIYDQRSGSSYIFIKYN